MAFKEMSNPFNYRAHYDAKIMGYYDPTKCTISFVNSEGAYGGAYFADILYTDPFSVDIRSTIRVTAFANTGWNIVAIYANDKQVTDGQDLLIEVDTEIRVEAKKQSILVNIINDDNSKIIVTHNGIEHTSSFYVDYGDSITIRAEAIGDGNTIKDIYVDGQEMIIGKSYTITKETTISARSGLVTCMVTINKYDHGQIVAYYNGARFVDNFEVNYGDSITVIAETDEDQGYYCQEIIADNDVVVQREAYTVLEDIELQAIIQMRQISVDIDQPENGQLTVQCGSDTHTSSFTTPWNSKISVSSNAESGYYVRDIHINQLNAKENTEYALTDDNVLVYANVDPVVVTRYYTITLTQSEHGTIKAYYDGTYYTESFQVPEGAMVTVWPEPDDEYTVNSFYINKQLQDDNPTYIFLAIRDYECSCDWLYDPEIVIPPVQYARLTVNKTYDNTVFNCSINDRLVGNAVYGYEVGTKLYIKPTFTRSLVMRSVNIDGTTTLSQNKYGEFEYTITKDCTLNFELGISISITQPANGQIRLTCSAAGLNNAVGTYYIIPYGAQYTLAAVPNTGFKVSSFNVTKL